MVAGFRTQPETAARAVIAHLARDMAGEASTAAARLLGVTVTGIVLARRRGCALVVALGLDVDATLAASGPRPA